MERIRDFLYDISDLLISLLIIAAIFSVISWKLNESIPIDTVSVPQTIEEPAADAPGEDPDAILAATEATTAPASGDASDADKPIDAESTTEAPAPTTEAKPAVATGKDIVIEIPSGSPGVAIGKILKDNGLITDVNAFIKKVDELGLGPKLRSGSFKLRTGMELEEIVKVLANVK